MHLAGVCNDLLVHLVTGSPDRVALDDASEGDHRDLSRTTADVDDHAAVRVHDRQAGADCGGHGLLDQVGLAGAGVESSVVDGALFNFSDTTGNADDDARPWDTEAVALMHGANEVMKHALSDMEV